MSGRGTAVGADLAQLAEQTRAGTPALGGVMQDMRPCLLPDPAKRAKLTRDCGANSRTHAGDQEMTVTRSLAR
jgi:hypothetical protein